MDKFELEELINKKMTISEMGRHFGVSRSTVVYWLNKYNLKTENRSIRDYPKRLYPPVEFVIETIKDSFCYADILRKLGLPEKGYQYTWIKNFIRDHSVDISHFFSKKKIYEYYKATPEQDQERFVEKERNKRIKSITLRSYLDRYEVKYACQICGISEWRGELIRLDIDHIDNDKLNNKIENLRYLCPNCHRLKTFPISVFEVKTTMYQCEKCNTDKTSRNALCIVCHKKSQAEVTTEGKPKIQWPTIEEMRKMVFEEPTLTLAKKLGVSDVAISKFCKKNNIPKPPRGYWAKLKVGKL